MVPEAILNKYICKVYGEKDFDSCYTSTLLGNNGSQIAHVKSLYYKNNNNGMYCEC